MYNRFNIIPYRGRSPTPPRFTILVAFVRSFLHPRWRRWSLWTGRQFVIISDVANHQVIAFPSISRNSRGVIWLCWLYLGLLQFMWHIAFWFCFWSVSGLPVGPKITIPSFRINVLTSRCIIQILIKSLVLQPLASPSIRPTRPLWCRNGKSHRQSHGITLVLIAENTMLVVPSRTEWQMEQHMSKIGNQCIKIEQKLQKQNPIA